MNTELLLRVKEQILTEPSRFDMYQYFLTERDESDRDLTYTKFKQCGTAACIAGWAIHLSGGVPDEIEAEDNEMDDRDLDYFYIAADRLDLSIEEAERLFCLNNWDDKDYFAYLEARVLKGKDRIASRVIDKFITEYS